MNVSWRSEASCRSLPWEAKGWFFADGESEGTQQQHLWARMVCYDCPSQLRCLRYCLDTGSNDGVWGGLTEPQRKRYLLKLRRDRPLTDDVLIDVLLRVGRPVLKKLEAGETPPFTPLAPQTVLEPAFA